MWLHSLLALMVKYCADCISELPLIVSLRHKSSCKWNNNYIFWYIFILILKTVYKQHWHQCIFLVHDIAWKIVWQLVMCLNFSLHASSHWGVGIKGTFVTLGVASFDFFLLLHLQFTTQWDKTLPWVYHVVSAKTKVGVKPKLFYILF